MRRRPRLQRLLNRAFQYDFDVEYIKGETNVVADCLSRLGVTKRRHQTTQGNDTRRIS